LKGISAAKAAALTRALGVHSIADLASKRYGTAAQTINTAAGSS
jgi:Na+/proline symporter